MVEILSGASVDLCQYMLERIGFLVRELARIMRKLRAMLNVFDQFLRELRGRQDHICKPGIDGSLRHAVIFRLIRLLDHDEPASLFDILEAH